MTVSPLEILPCPPQLRTQALSLVLCELAPSQRLEIAGPIANQIGVTPTALDGLFVAHRGDVLCGAVWAQRQPGNTAVLWPPQLTLDADRSTANALAEAAVQHLDRAEIAMSQVLLSSQDDPAVPLLESMGFYHLANLVYLACEADRFPTEIPKLPEIEFVPYDASQRDRFMHLIEQTYEGTLDCPALNGTRRMENVLEGYQATGKFRAENWLIVRIGGKDAGVLLLSDHPSARHWELVYMGLTPQARGRGRGRQITRHAQALARRASAERIVLAVDAANSPALRTYRGAGFEAWDRRTVYVRFFQRAKTG